MTRNLWSWSAASLLALAAPATLAAPAPAATILERSIEVEIRPDGSTVEQTRLAVRLDSPADLSSWSTYPIYLDENRKLEEVTAFATTPEGRKVQVSRRDLDTLEYAGEGMLHTSGKFRTVTFPVVPPGSVLTVAHRVKVKPYFSADRIALADSDPTAKLHVSVRGGGPGWRWRIDGPRDGLTIQETPGGVTVTAASLPGQELPALAPGDAGPVLRYGWGETGGWPDVGRWYDELIAGLPRQSEPVRRQARELTASARTPREKLAALLGFTARQVRYVAVEVGIGGYRPFAPDKVLERRWGDCKDKALLLVDMLREVGIEAYPAIIRLADDERIDPEFPDPGQFNHVIVAVQAGGIAEEGDPVAEGLLFVDPTDDTGSIRYLHPGVQDQDALVARGPASRLVRTPVRPDLEARRLTVDMTVSPSGAEGEARLEVTGSLGAAFSKMITAAKQQEVEDGVRMLLNALMPGSDFTKVLWSAGTTELPSASVSARVRFPALAREGGATPAFSLPAMTSSPAPSLLQDRNVPVVLSPGLYQVSWRVRLPEGSCPPKPDEQKVDNEVGTFRQSVSAEGGVMKVERTLELRQRWIEPARFPALKEISLAELRASKRRLRFECE